MVQAYGATASRASSETNVPTPAARESETSTLLSGRGPAPDEEGHASLASCVGNLTNTIIGSGMLTFPMAMSSAGLIPGMLTCLFSGSVAAFALYLLSLCATRAPHRRASFFAVAELTFPRAAVFFDAAIAIKCFGVSISYLIIIKGLMPNVVQSLYHDLTGPDTNPPAWALDGRVWITLFMAVLIPLAFLRRLDSLRHASFIGLFAVVYLLVVVVWCFFFPLAGTTPRGEVHLIHFTPSFVSTFPVQVFAFTCAQNLFPLYNEMYANTQARMTTLVGASIGSATLTYEVIGVLGYLTFGSKVGANIIAMYPASSLFIAVGQLAIVVLVLVSYPLQVHPARNCLDKVFHAGQAHKALATDEDGAADAGDDEHGSPDMGAGKHAALTAGLVASGFAIAYFVDDLRMVLAFVGSTGSTTISFILPGLFYWQLTRNEPGSSKLLSRGALALFIYGICVCVFCLSFNIFQLVAGHGAAGH